MSVGMLHLLHALPARKVTAMYIELMPAGMAGHHLTMACHTYLNMQCCMPTCSMNLKAHCICLVSCSGAGDQPKPKRTAVIVLAGGRDDDDEDDAIEIMDDEEEGAKDHGTKATKDKDQEAAGGKAGAAKGGKVGKGKGKGKDQAAKDREADRQLKERQKGFKDQMRQMKRIRESVIEKK